MSSSSISIIRWSRLGLVVAALALLAAALVVPSLGSSAGADTTIPATPADVVVHDAVPVSFASGVESAPPQSHNDETSCPADGECVSAGIVITADVPAQYRPFVTVQHSGVWGEAQLLTFDGPVDMTGGLQRIDAMTCVAPGECDGIGTIKAPPILYRPFHFHVSGGVAHISELLSTFDGSHLLSAAGTQIACSSPGECLIGGRSQNDVTPGIQPVEWWVHGGVTQIGGLIPLPASIYDPAHPGAEVEDVECPAQGACVELGWSTVNALPNFAGNPWVRVQTNGTWGDVQIVEFPAGVIDLAGLRGGFEAYILECWAVGSCVITGEAPLSADAGWQHPFAVSLTGGVLGAPQLLDTTGFRATDASWWISSMDCGGVGSCMAIANAIDQTATTNLGSASFTFADGTWSPAARIALPTGAASMRANSVGCIAPGSCVISATANFAAPAPVGSHIYVYTQRQGVWAAPVRVSGSASIAGDFGYVLGTTCVKGGSACNVIGLMGSALMPDAIESSSLRSSFRPSIAGTGVDAIDISVVYLDPPAPTTTTTVDTSPVAPTFTG